MTEHDWIRDPEQRDEGLICRNCGLTEAEAEASPGRGVGRGVGALASIRGPGVTERKDI